VFVCELRVELVGLEPFVDCFLDDRREGVRGQCFELPCSAAPCRSRYSSKRFACGVPSLDEFKVDEGIAAYLARGLMLEYPELNGWVNVRA
jgi:hypothetical protein